jgi:thymidine kinase
MPCIVINSAEELLSVPHEVEIIAIDECQFLGQETPKIIETLVQAGYRVIVAGLDMDYNGTPFDPMPQLLARAESVLKVTAVCTMCGENATHTYLRSGDENSVKGEPAVLVGDANHYGARCRKHWKR